MAEIDPSLVGLIRSLHPELRIALTDAMALIAESGILEKYVEEQATAIGRHAVGLTDEELLEQIKRLRAESHGLILLHNYGLELAQDKGIEQ